MLVVTRSPGEKILIGDDIVVTVIEVRGDSSVRVGIDAPREIRVLRQEVADAVAAQNRAASASADDAASIAAALGRGAEPAS